MSEPPVVWFCPDADDTRFLLHRAGVGPVGYEPSGRPYLPGRGLSISHGRGVAAVAVGGTGSLGVDVERGELPMDEGLLGNLIRGICFENAKAYFGLECGAV